MPKYCLISALSTKAKSIVPVIFEVAKIKILEYVLILSICVSSAFTTLIESDGSFPAEKNKLQHNSTFQSKYFLTRYTLTPSMR